MYITNKYSRYTPLQLQTIMYYSLDENNYTCFLELQKNISKLKKQYADTGDESINQKLQSKIAIFELILDRVFLDDVNV